MNMTLSDINERTNTNRSRCKYERGMVVKVTGHSPRLEGIAALANACMQRNCMAEEVNGRASPSFEEMPIDLSDENSRLPWHRDESNGHGKAVEP